MLRNIIHLQKKKSAYTEPPRTSACLWNMASATLAAQVAMARTRTTYLFYGG